MLKGRTFRIVVWVLFCIYCTILAYILFCRKQFDIGTSYWELLKMNINCVPLYTISQNIYLLVYRTNEHLIQYALVNLFGNIVAFIPFGCLLPYLRKKFRSFKCFFLFLTSVIILIEVVQLFSLRGCFDIDDLILNLIGGIIGYFIYYFIAACCKVCGRI